MQQFSNLMRIVSFLLFFVTSATSDTGATATATMTAHNGANQQTATEMHLDVVTYECDDQMKRLDQEYLQKRKLGRSYRFCIEPNELAKKAGIGIKQLESFTWAMYADEEVNDVVQETVKDGKMTPGITYFQCIDGGNLCAFDSMLGTGFYEWNDSVIGNGSISFTAGLGSVPFEFSLFLKTLTFSFTTRQNEDGTLEFINKKPGDEDAKENRALSAEEGDAKEEL